MTNQASKLTSVAPQSDQPRCVGYPNCDGDLPGEWHERDCPVYKDDVDGPMRDKFLKEHGMQSDQPAQVELCNGCRHPELWEPAIPTSKSGTSIPDWHHTRRERNEDGDKFYILCLKEQKVNERK